MSKNTIGRRSISLLLGTIVKGNEAGPGLKLVKVVVVVVVLIKFGPGAI